ncbi:hypothetical protein EDD27_2515 [Nonomuraea polychroma]|uniref:Uncharacterized protein n=1 Tax=Nonomuraea polychroma TaxID=46176 RepID=A0A438M2X9_9ACTN|nr:hypothetical protein EDD27_2515 [Nonomuraea polychroma]
MNIGLPELLVILAFLAVGALVIGGIVFVVVKLANRGRR